MDFVSAHQRKHIVLMVMVAFSAVLANLPDSVSHQLNLQKEWLLAVLGLIIVLGFFLYARLSFFFLTIMLALGANLPDRWASALEVDRFPLLVALGVMILGAIINQTSRLMPTGLEEKPRLRNADGTRALIGAISRNQIKAINTIVSMNLDLNEVDEQGTTPLEAAARQGDLSVVQLLLSNGANPNWRNPAGLTPAEVAEQSGNYRVASLLRNMSQPPSPMPAAAGN
jgi:hypothetical protein